MKIGLIDVDGHNFPNLALMKISAWFKQQGATVDWCNRLEYYDIVCKVKVFDFTPDDETIIQADEIYQGGTGYNIYEKLPTEIESMFPDYGLYPQYKEAYGFLTRGCPRNCKFCIVSRKEGRCSTKVADLGQFWNGQKTIKLLDPNLLACKDWKGLMQQLIDSKAKVDFTQGLDIRLMTDRKAYMLNSVNVETIHFAWDNYEFKTYEQLKRFRPKFKYDYRKLKVYVLTNFNTTHEQDLERVYKLKELGYDPYIMIYDKYNAPIQTRYLQRWVNNKIIFRSTERFEEYNHKIG